MPIHGKSFHLFHKAILNGTIFISPQNSKVLPCNFVWLHIISNAANSLFWVFKLWLSEPRNLKGFCLDLKFCIFFRHPCYLMEGCPGKSIVLFTRLSPSPLVAGQCPSYPPGRATCKCKPYIYLFEAPPHLKGIGQGPDFTSAQFA